MQNNSKKRCSAYISEANYGNLEEYMKQKTVVNMSMSKGAVIDIALSHLFIDSKDTDFDTLVIEHLNFIGDDTNGI